VLELDLGDGFERRGDFEEAFLFGLGAKVLVDGGPFHLFAVGRRLEILGRVADHAGRIGGHDFDVAALEELEEALGVLLLVVGRFQEEGRDLFEAGLLGRAGEIGIAVAGLGLAGESRQQVFLGLDPLIDLAMFIPSFYAFQSPCTVQYSRAVTAEALTQKCASGAWPGLRKAR